MKLCIIGNSHTACLKQGWDKLNVLYPDIDITFFASRAQTLGALRHENGALMPTDPNLANDLEFTSNGKREIRLDEYDVFLVYGLDFALPRLDRRLSAAVAAQACADSFSRSLNNKIARLIRISSANPVFVSPTPLHATNAPAGPVPPPYAIGEVEAILQKLTRDLNLEVVVQPESTVTDDWHTRSDYSRDSIRLDLGYEGETLNHPANDVTHMNHRFGEIFLRHFFADHLQAGR